MAGEAWQGIDIENQRHAAIAHDGGAGNAFDAAEVLLKPAAPGTGVIAGAVVRAIMELGGVKDVVTKVIGRTSNSINVAHATFEAVKGLRTPEEIRRLRGKDRLPANEA